MSDVVIEIVSKIFEQADEQGCFQFIKLGSPFSEHDSISAHTKQRYSLLCKILFPLENQIELFESGFVVIGDFIYDTHYHDIEKWKEYKETADEKEKRQVTHINIKKQRLFIALCSAVAKAEFEWSLDKIVKKIDITRINEIQIKAPSKEYVDDYLSADLLKS